MENQKEAVNKEEHNCCGFGHHLGMHGFHFLRFFILAALLVFVFSIGLAFGRVGSFRHGHDSYGYGRNGGWGMMGGRYNRDGRTSEYFRGCSGLWNNNAGTGNTGAAPTDNTATGTTNQINTNSNK